jgi:hypothetical protein
MITIRPIMTLLRGIAVLVAAALLWAAQIREPEEPRLPDGKSQKEAILKQEHEKSLRDAAELLTLAEELKAELEKNDRHVVSISSLRKTEEIEKLAKRIRNRLKH